LGRGPQKPERARHKPAYRTHTHTRGGERTKVQKEATIGRGGERHKGRIERLRVRLAYGFEARTQHQLSSSWHKGGGDAKEQRKKKQGRTTESNRQKTKAHTHTRAAGQQRHFASGAPTPSQCGPLLDFSSHNAARSALQRWSSPRRHSTEKHRKTKTRTNQQQHPRRAERTKQGAGEATVRFQGLWFFLTDAGSQIYACSWLSIIPSRIIETTNKQCGGRGS